MNKHILKYPQVKMAVTHVVSFLLACMAKLVHINTILSQRPQRKKRNSQEHTEEIKSYSALCALCTSQLLCDLCDTGCFIRSKFFTAVVFLILAGNNVHAQQISEFSLIRENAVALNPAMTGVQGYMSGLATFRKEFTQISGSPYTAFVMMEGQVADKNIGIGGAVIADQTGPTGRIGGTISASYQLKIGRAYDYVNAERGHYNTATDHMITFGLSLSFMQFRVNGSELNPLQTGDPQLFSNNVYKFAPDAAFGIYYQWMQHLYIGVSVPQILGLNESFTGHNGVANIQTVRHFNMLAGGKIDVVKGKFSIDPVGAFRWVKNAPPQGDIGTRFTFINSIWVGGTYRSLNTFVLDAGVEIKTMIRISYAYDYHFASYTTDIGPTHELTVAFRYNHIPLRQMKMIGGEYR